MPTPSSTRQPLQPMPARTIAVISAGIFVLTAAVVLALWWAGTAGLTGQALVTARFDALRTGLSIGIGGGGIFALYLAWRRQHATEVGLVQKERDQADVARAYELQVDLAEHTRQVAEHNRLHAERVAAATEKDAADRRVTELYTKASEQLGSDKAPVRLAGLYALERLAQDNPHQRQTVVNVLCAYLRMPYTLPGNPPDDDTDEPTRTRHDTSLQEHEVRLTAQHILTTHLNTGTDPDHPAQTFWADTDLNLTGAALTDFDLRHCRVRDARFTRATFTGDALFERATFTRDALFNLAKFAGTARFGGATFAGTARFVGATFTGTASFGGATFTGTAWLAAATFTGDAWFGEATFAGDAWFGEATFTGDALFERATFTRGALFNQATFDGDALFNQATFTGTAQFSEAKFTGTARFGEATFTGTTLFNQAKFTGDALFNQAKFTGTTRFERATFTGDPWFDQAITRHPVSNSNWPAGWTPTDDHTPISGREGTWHHLQRS
ncbi:pentapeptide repeat-containing protein [Lentzea sp. CA-135723]|uniref:pentapeptide repeat-containing protein n=1 Tax=Lentzea sp. CA-135723 TaxID=3239950 RepID=UPI003D93C356